MQVNSYRLIQMQLMVRKIDRFVAKSLSIIINVNRKVSKLEHSLHITLPCYIIKQRQSGTVHTVFQS